MGKFEISKRKNGEFQFNLKAGNGQVILTSEGYTTKANCQNGIESVKKNSTVDERYDRKESKNNKWYFNLKATNGQIIGTSEMYESAASRDNGIESVKKNAPDATVVDLTIEA
ncbi:YegP family protein [Dysgonomonas sp. OttesenSCG-928-M03]|nr:YegP family protein [Dysgonomonas sp. OttesenSCG-928-M03]